jgi:hypothetical protein
MFDINQPIHDEYGEGDESRARDYIEGLMEEFGRSSEWQSVRETCEYVFWAATMMEYAINYIGCSLPKMTLRDFNEVIFELFPGKV